VLQAVEKMKQRVGLSSTDSKPLTTTSDERNDEQYDRDENTVRGNWAGRLDFVLSLIGSVSRGQAKVI